ncbi:Golgi-associated plant pathogenesis-related protein 1 [Orchesella cincta]|uniref:Golgi-associated plant pathogenesis-related protein 1 n=1 Tax=Orchesella cincta TaxID=48709 RepID=A0A1D2NIU4_ORCCI|nr:Golgi-associated plant pathogenesis-related protein 1 [Orchesella cincta]
MSLLTYCRHIGIVGALTVITICYASKPCPPLSVLPGTEVHCEFPVDNRAFNCLDANSSVPKGTIARYKCERDANFSENYIKCKCRGRWGGLRRFNDFMSSCNISDYSIDGPAELNLTDTQIYELAPGDPRQVKDYQEDGAAYHNFYRQIHHSPSLKLNKTLSDAAQKWADQEVDKPTLRTQDWSDRWYSQNIYRIQSYTVDAREAVRLAVAAWYQGAYRYDWENPSGQSAFTQVVWKSTSDLGIGVARKGNLTMVVADYWPPGNVVVENGDVSARWAWFRENVFPPNPINETLMTTTTTTTTMSSIPSSSSSPSNLPSSSNSSIPSNSSSSLSEVDHSTGVVDYPTTST